ncbi:polysaccharide biosynthesis protein [Chrysiogenes arsenatis]|uniref:polysaccharide biosynthesis protein n=1 Tax=Chrysiogenes arsenatis TaxID=309797 RepID=UPI0004285E59|nr:nucleoside-diphosphate sugar epimerase/dehydratase [Chrysiogenes arsenatis]
MKRLNHKTLILVFCDILLIILASILAFLLRFELFGLQSEMYLDWFSTGLLAALIAKPPVFYLFGIYRSVVRYTSIPEVVRIVQASVVASIASFALFLFLNHFGAFSRSIILLDFLLTTGLLIGIRLAWRMLKDGYFFQQHRGDEPIIVIGTHDLAVSFVKSTYSPHSPYWVAGIIDLEFTATRSSGKLISGVEVIGGLEVLGGACEKLGVKQVVIAEEEISVRKVREIVDRAPGHLNFSILPRRGLIAHEDLLSQVRSLDMEDLLGRDAVQIDTDGIARYIAGKVVMVSGAGGSIGAEICRQIARFAPRQIVLVEQAETPLYQIELELRESFPAVAVVPYIVDIRHRDRLRSVFALERPDTVFHAAAYKHVPMMEMNPCESVSNNLFGTQTIADCAEEVGVKNFVMISTDKAVNPTNVMGATKRAAEIYVQMLSSSYSQTKFTTVRFGNVLGSNGSVVPRFLDQIRRGGPVTVTHPEVTRYFMTIPEAAQLVLQAGSMGKGGEIYLLDMGEPVKIVQLAERLIKLGGLSPYQDIDIQFTGLRPGEKLYEELLIDGENIARTEHQKIMILAAREQQPEVVAACMSDLRLAIAEDHDAKLLRALKAMVPEFAHRRDNG